VRHFFQDALSGTIEAGKVVNSMFKYEELIMVKIHIKRLRALISDLDLEFESNKIMFNYYPFFCLYQ